MLLLAEIEGPDQTAMMRSVRGLRCPHTPEDTFALGATHLPFVNSFIITNMRRNVRKLTFSHVRQAKIQIRIRAVWSESSLGLFG